MARMSNRNGVCPARYSRRNCRAIRERCRCLSWVTASSGEPTSSRKVVRVFTSTNASVAPSYPTRSISPFIPRDVKFRAIMTYPLLPKIPIRVGLAANAGAARFCPAAAVVGGADESARPFRAAQFTKPNIALARIGKFSPAPSWRKRARACCITPQKAPPLKRRATATPPSPSRML